MGGSSWGLAINHWHWAAGTWMYCLKSGIPLLLLCPRATPADATEPFHIRVLVFGEVCLSSWFQMDFSLVGSKLEASPSGIGRGCV